MNGWKEREQTFPIDKGDSDSPMGDSPFLSELSQNHLLSGNPIWHSHMWVCTKGMVDADLLRKKWQIIALT